MVDLALERHAGGERGFVFPSCEFGTLLCLQNGIVLTASLLEHRFYERFGNPEERLLVVFFGEHFCILEILCNGNSNVGRERPGGCCPDDEELVCLTFEGELDEDRGVVLVPVFHFSVRNRRFAPGTPVHDTVPAFEHALFFCPCKCPPCRLNIFRHNGLVCSGKIQPDPEVGELVIHQELVLDRKLPAFLDELLDTELLDILFWT